MKLQDEQVPQEVPKIVQPRDHKAKVCVWADLTVDDVDRINESLNADHIKMVLADRFHLDDYRENLRSGIVMDLYHYTLQFARDNDFSKEQTSTFFSIIKKTHEVCIETPFGNVDQTFNYFKELVLCHAVNRPPHSIELFGADQVRLITEYAINSYFRHFKMYKYAFTPLVRLDLSLNYVGMPETPAPSEVAMAAKPQGRLSPVESNADTLADVNDDDAIWDDYEAGDEDQAVHIVEESPEGEVTGDGEAPDGKAPDPDESPARKELRGMIQTYLTEEIKKMKVSVDEQLKSTEELLNKKIDVVEGSQARKSGGTRNSGKGAKKK